MVECEGTIWDGNSRWPCGRPADVRVHVQDYWHPHPVCYRCLSNMIRGPVIEKIEPVKESIDSDVAAREVGKEGEAMSNFLEKEHYMWVTTSDHDDGTERIYRYGTLQEAIDVVKDRKFEATIYHVRPAVKIVETFEVQDVSNRPKPKPQDVPGPPNPPRGPRPTMAG